MGADATEMTAEASTREALLLSRVLITWVELVVVGFAGAVLGGAASGPPQLVVYFATILASVAVLLYNVDRLIAARIRDAA
ncbi:hypothetical protein [Halorubrum sp. PV6]|uniref:hypothetical protein n=1 Tax=Halorubrum sp. PV6 TaxID=634157 RepID=UPI000F85381D|nr:hypothetical protein [Halorubrum sp. PV6]AZQ15279.1 hypothetical protein DOS48_10795 [Halorubrum sp. PV6]